TKCKTSSRGSSCWRPSCSTTGCIRATRRRRDKAIDRRHLKSCITINREERMKVRTIKWTAFAAALVLAALPLFAAAQEEGGTKTARELRADYDKSLKGKTIAYLPIALGVPLSDEWGRVVQEEAEWRGMKYIVRDPNNNPSAMQQALTALVDQKPDVLIVQTPSVTLLMKDLKRAESQGTHVIQINMASNYKSGAFVGADWNEIGKLLATEVVKQCGTGSGKSGKVQIIQGELTAAASVDQVAGIMEVLNKDS